jgi:hypothetical protein
MSDYSFFNTDRIGADVVDDTQRNMENTRYSSYMLTNYHNFADPTQSSQYVNFATQQPNVMFSGVSNGYGLGSSLVDVDSNLTIKTEQERSLEKLSLSQRPFITVPYLGRGSCDPLLEAQILQGETSQDKKSVSTIMSKSFMDYTQYPLDSEMKNLVSDVRNTIEESALAGWVRGGVQTRELAQDGAFVKQARPNLKF